MNPVPSTQTAAAQRPISPVVPTLRVLYCGGEGIVSRTALVLCDGDIPIGRQVTAGVCLPHDLQVSRHHATVQCARHGQSLSIVDGDGESCSKNGVFVNGRRTTAGPLYDGDVVRVGNTFLLVRYQPADQTDAQVPGIVGLSPAMHALRREVRLVAPTPARVLLLGETGTGKEVVAQALHQHSARASGPMEVLDCGAVPRNLIESELFGHEKGAFTGADRQRRGLFEAAHGGTLFIDELGELPLDLQPMLLRVLEQGVVRRIGGSQPIQVDIRVIAATNRDMDEAIRAGTFRGDLYARLAEIVLPLPPLRERREDVLPLLHHALGPHPGRLSPELVERLLLHVWPYNVREVFKLAMELRVRGEGRSVLDVDLVMQRLRPLGGGGLEPDAAQDEDLPGKDELESWLRASRGVVSEVARVKGCSRRQIYRWMEHHGIDLDRFRPRGR